MTVKIKLDTRRLDEITGGLKSRVDEVLADFAFRVEGEAKQLAPFDTGALEGSIYTVTKNDDGYQDASSEAKRRRPGVQTEPHPYPNGQVVARVGPCVEYAAYVELGTSKMAARPYLVPALENVARKFNDPSEWKEVFR